MATVVRAKLHETDGNFCTIPINTPSGAIVRFSTRHWVVFTPAQAHTTNQALGVHVLLIRLMHTDLAAFEEVRRRRALAEEKKKDALARVNATRSQFLRYDAREDGGTHVLEKLPPLIVAKLESLKAGPNSTYCTQGLTLMLVCLLIYLQDTLPDEDTLCVNDILDHVGYFLYAEAAQYVQSVGPLQIYKHLPVAIRTMQDLQVHARTHSTESRRYTKHDYSYSLAFTATPVYRGRHNVQQLIDRRLWNFCDTDDLCTLLTGGRVYVCPFLLRQHAVSCYFWLMAEWLRTRLLPGQRYNNGQEQLQEVAEQFYPYIRGFKIEQPIVGAQVELKDTSTKANLSILLDSIPTCMHRLLRRGKNMGLITVGSIVRHAIPAHIARPLIDSRQWRAMLAETAKGWDATVESRMNKLHYVASKPPRDRKRDRPTTCHKLAEAGLCPHHADGIDCTEAMMQRRFPGYTLDVEDEVAIKITSVEAVIKLAYETMADA